MRKIPWASAFQIAGNVANIAAFAFLVWAYFNPYVPGPATSPSPTQQPAADEKIVRARLPTTVLAGIALILGGGLNTAAVLIRRRRGPAPPLMFFAHDRAIAKNPTLALQARELFEKAGYRMTIGQTNVPRHAEGVWLHGGTFAERNFAAWGLETLGITPQIDYTEGHPPCLQVIVGEYETPRRKYSGVEVMKDLAAQQMLQDHPRIALERDSLKAALTEMQTEREGLRGQLGAAQEAFRTCNRAFALARLRWIAERRAASGSPPRVRVRFAEYSDFALAESIKQIFEEHTKWPVTLDRSNDPVMRPSDEFKVIFVLSKFEAYSSLAAIFEEGQLVAGKVGIRRDDHEDSSLVVVEVLPTVKA